MTSSRASEFDPRGRLGGQCPRCRKQPAAIASFRGSWPRSPAYFLCCGLPVQLHKPPRKCLRSSMTPRCTIGNRKRKAKPRLERPCHRHRRTTPSAGCNRILRDPLDHGPSRRCHLRPIYPRAGPRSEMRLLEYGSLPAHGRDANCPANPAWQARSIRADIRNGGCRNDTIGRPR